jgi:hypothetical protein
MVTVKRNPPVQPKPTFDLIGLTEEQVAWLANSISSPDTRKEPRDLTCIYHALVNSIGTVTYNKILQGKED